jgi:hypothetical protein
MEKVLFTTPILGFPASGGPELSVENVINALGKISKLHVLSRELFLEKKETDSIKHYSVICHSLVFVTSVNNIYNRF